MIWHKNSSMMIYGVNISVFSGSVKQINHILQKKLQSAEKKSFRPLEKVPQQPIMNNRKRLPVDRFLLEDAVFRNSIFIAIWRRIEECAAILHFSLRCHLHFTCCKGILQQSVISESKEELSPCASGVLTPAKVPLRR
jgi:hypothetical protein